MLNWIKFISVFLIALTSVIVVTVFYNANKPLAVCNKTAADAAIESGQFIRQFCPALQWNASFMTVFGVDEDGEEIAVFVDEAMEKDYEQ